MDVKLVDNSSSDICDSPNDNQANTSNNLLGKQHALNSNISLNVQTNSDKRYQYMFLSVFCAVSKITNILFYFTSLMKNLKPTKRDDHIDSNQLALNNNVPSDDDDDVDSDSDSVTPKTHNTSQEDLANISKLINQFVHIKRLVRLSKRRRIMNFLGLTDGILVTAQPFRKIKETELLLPERPPIKLAGANCTAENIIKVLIAYCKNPRFLDKFIQSGHFESIFQCLTEVVHSSMRNAPTEKDHNLWASNQKNMNKVGDQSLDPVAALHYTFSKWVSNLSAHFVTHNRINCDLINQLIEFWILSPSLHLNLCGWKIKHNLHAHETRSSVQPSSSKTTWNLQPNKSIFYPNVYRLDVPKNMDEDYDFDIVFVNGFQGGIFHTWRQHDSVLMADDENVRMNYSKCWPRDWLSTQFPRARIIGVDASLKPFIWNYLCPMRRPRRTLDHRAMDVLGQLKMAGVGYKPIIWITHSAGAILVKEMLRLETSLNEPPLRCINSYNPKDYVSNDQLETSVDSALVDMSSNTNIPPIQSALPSPCKWHCYESADDSAIGTRCSEEQSACNADDDGDDDPNLINLNDKRKSVGGLSNNNLATTDSVLLVDFIEQFRTCDMPQIGSSTTGIVFISAPHCGNQCLHALYKRAFRWMLTPEAKQLDNAGVYVHDLHTWFKTWSGQHSVKILSLVETLPTTLTWFWSTIIVPGHPHDFELGESVLLNADHINSSKPTNPNDLVYTHIVNFIRNVFAKSETS